MWGWGMGGWGVSMRSGGCGTGGPHGPSSGDVGLGVSTGSGGCGAGGCGAGGCGAGGLCWEWGMWGWGSPWPQFWGIWGWVSPLGLGDVGLGVPTAPILGVPFGSAGCGAREPIAPFWGLWDRGLWGWGSPLGPGDVGLGVPHCPILGTVDLGVPMAPFWGSALPHCKGCGSGGPMGSPSPPDPPPQQHQLGAL